MFSTQNIAFQAQGTRLHHPSVMWEANMKLPRSLSIVAEKNEDFKSNFLYTDDVMLKMLH